MTTVGAAVAAHAAAAAYDYLLTEDMRTADELEPGGRTPGRGVWLTDEELEWAEHVMSVQKEE